MRVKVVHIELGELGESESELRAVAGFLIANEIRNIIQGLPREWRKQVVIEEMVSFLKDTERRTNLCRLLANDAEIRVSNGGYLPELFHVIGS